MEQAFLQFVRDNLVMCFAIYWVFMAAVSALPPATESSGMGYKFLSSFLHGLAGNLKQIKDNMQLPPAKDK